MFLNQDGQPVIFREFSNLHSNITDNELENLRESVMLLSSMKALVYNRSLKNWCGQIYSSEAIGQNILDNFVGLRDMVFAEKSKPFTLTLKSGKAISITTVPIGERNNENNVLFILHDLNEGLVSICIDIFDGHYDAFISSQDLQNALNSGVDILYIDDSCFLPHFEGIQSFISKEQFRNLVSLIKPKKLIGLVGANIPNYIESILVNES